MQKDVAARFLLFERKRRYKAETPLPPGMKLTKESKEAETNRQREYAESFPYQSVVGALIMYLAVHTKPDRAYTVSCIVNLLLQFNTRLTYVACQAARIPHCTWITQ